MTCTTLIILSLSTCSDSNLSLSFISFDLHSLFSLVFISNPILLFLPLVPHFFAALLSLSDILPPFLYNAFNEFMLFFSISHPSLSCSSLSYFLSHTFFFCYIFPKILYLFWLIIFYFSAVPIFVNVVLSAIYLGHLELANICVYVASYRCDFKLTSPSVLLHGVLFFLYVFQDFNRFFATRE